MLTIEQANAIKDALRATQEMWDHLHRFGLSGALMREYNDALTVLEKDFAGRLAQLTLGVLAADESQGGKA